jgi:3',5'-cyclic-nucleotide phosphodiesterase
MKPNRIFYLFILIGIFLFNQTKTIAQHSFKIVPLGVKGGIDESNLSAYMLAVDGTDDYVCLDAGTLHTGIQKAVDNGIFKVSAGVVLKRYIKGYFISHGHLDHCAGLIINSPEDSTKNIYGLPFCLDVLRNNYFTWESWANFGNEGEKPALSKYHYTALTAGKDTAIANTTMDVTAFPLSHVAPQLSTAFLIGHHGNYVLYLGDTGADEIENTDKLHKLWEQVAPLVSAKKLKAILIETSFPDEQPIKSLFGHLTPNLLMNEMNVLANMAGRGNMKNLPIVITHIKPNGNNEAMIKRELMANNPLQLKLIFPVQAKLLEF